MPASSGRILSLDVLRGLAVLGILAVNAPFFAHPFHALTPPSAWPFPASATGDAIALLVRTFFEAKFITMFSMLFGASIFLVGGERRDPARSPVLHRRLGWLALFGMLHGALVWYGDVLLAYALAGFLVLLARSWTPRRLIVIGGSLYGAVALFALAAAVGSAYLPDDPLPAAVHRAGYMGGFFASLRANAIDWVTIGGPMVLGHVVFSGPLMLAGMGLLKAGVLEGAAPPRIYRRLVLGGALALLALGAVGVLGAHLGPRSAAAHGFEALVTGTAPIITLGYAGLIILALRRAGQSGLLARILAPVGRMAFTNYILQSVVMTTIFYGGRGLGLYGQMDRPALAAVVLGVWAAQIVLSRWWLSRFAMGPLEWGWRRLSRGRAPGSGPSLRPA